MSHERDNQEGHGGLDRRDFLHRAAGMGVGLAATMGLAACGSPPRARGGPATTRVSPTTSGPPDVSAWTELQTALGGRLIRPADPGYATAVQLFDPRYDTVRPAAVATCASASDVQRCIGFARAHGLAPIPRSGGHSYGGYSTGSGLVIDVSGLHAVAPSTASAPASVGAGARLIDVYTTLNAAGASVPAGSCPTVGIAGLALGGGAGVVDRRYGLTCDAMTAVQIITADGVVHRADAGTDADLFWACRGGGGGNFGIVTSFQLSSFPTSELTLASLAWPWAAASQVLPAWLSWAPASPDELWSNCLLSTDPANPAPTVHVGVVWSGPPGSLDPLIDRLVTAVGGGPISRGVETTSFAHAMYVEGGCSALGQTACHLVSRGGALNRQPTLGKSDYLDKALGDGGVAATLAGIDSRRSGGGRAAVGYDAYGGAINRVAADATAFVHRSSLASAQYNVDFDPGAPSAQLLADQTFLDGWYASLRPYVSGAAYQNYIDPHLAGWATAYYGSNLARLSEIKAEVDPDDVFRFAQSIPPPGTG